jgi:hypothetical protein
MSRAIRVELSHSALSGVELIQYSVLQVFQYQRAHVLRAREPQIGCTELHALVKIGREIQV